MSFNSPVQKDDAISDVVRFLITHRLPFRLLTNEEVPRTAKAMILVFQSSQFKRVCRSTVGLESLAVHHSHM